MNQAKDVNATTQAQAFELFMCLIWGYTSDDIQPMLHTDTDGQLRKLVENFEEFFAARNNDFDKHFHEVESDFFNQFNKNAIITARHFGAEIQGPFINSKGYLYTKICFSDGSELFTGVTGGSLHHDDKCLYL